MPISVSIVEDHAATRAALVALVSNAPGFRLVSAHADAEEALAALPLSEVDVVLVDLLLPKMSGVELTRELKAKRPSVFLLALTVVPDTQVVFRALQNGASGYLLKRTPSAEVLSAITEVKAGGMPMSRTIAREVLGFFQRLPRPDPGLDDLTERETEILKELATGYTDKEIAAHLGISFHTVRMHVRGILQKLHAVSRLEAAVKYTRSTLAR